MPSWFMPKLFDKMKQVAIKSDRQMFQSLFTNPNVSSLGDKELLSELNKKANEDPYNFQIPEGYVMSR